MKWKIVIQPDGNYALWSRNVDNFIAVGSTEQQICEIFIEEAIKEFEKKVTQINFDVRRVINELKKGKKPYYQFTMSFKECIETVELVHGVEERAEIWKLIGKIPKVQT